MWRSRISIIIHGLSHPRPWDLIRAAEARAVVLPGTGSRSGRDGFTGENTMGILVDIAVIGRLRLAQPGVPDPVEFGETQMAQVEVLPTNLRELLC